MITETTRRAGSFADLSQAVEALTYLQVTYPTMPAPHVSVLHNGRCLDLQAQDPAAFETWRTALQVPSGSVTLRAYGGGVWLETRTTVRGVAVVLTGHGVPLTADEARTTQALPTAAPSQPFTVYSAAGPLGGGTA